MRWPVPVLVAAVLLLTGGAAQGAAPITLQNLRCEYLQNPVGIDVPRPRLGWQMASSRRSQGQTAYQVLVADRPEILRSNRGNLWDSGKVRSDASIQIPYEGKPLDSGQRAYWKVRVWDRDGRPTAYSAPVYWEMGQLQKADWNGRWIGRTTATEPTPAPLLRREFRLDGKVKRARAYVSGLGYYELRLNGKKVGDHRLDPGFTRYDRRVLYTTYDVTPHLKQGENAVGVMLGNGWHNVFTRTAWDWNKAPWRAAPRLLMDLEVEYEDGRSFTLSTDGSWKTADSPIRFHSIYEGEAYDAREEQPGWDRPGFDDSEWTPALVVDPPKGMLKAQMMPPIRVTGAIKPVRVTEPKAGVFLFDLGQNIAGIPRLSVSGPAGTKVVMRFGEKLYPDGALDTRNIDAHVKGHGADQLFQTDTYILNGRGTEVWEPRFTYHGFQYVEMTGFPGKPTARNLTGLVMHTNVESRGRFACSHPLLNRIQRNARWSYLGNLHGIPTDCPHREKNGWTGDAHLAAEMGMYNFYPPAVYTKWIDDLADEQRDTGELPGIVPTSGWGYQWGNGPAWDSAFLLIPRYLYDYYGDTRILSDHYEGMRRYVDYLTTKAQDGIVSIGLGDWVPPGPTAPEAVTSTGYYYRDALIVSEAARLLGKTDDARRYADLASEIKKAFNRKFVNPATGMVADGSQTSLGCALYQGLLEPEHEAAVFKQLLAEIERRDTHLFTGILGAKYVPNVLLDHGRADVAYRMFTQTTYPSYGHWIEQGATTLWESWNGNDSRNHIMFGDISAWFFKVLAGINADAPGFKRIRIQPRIVGGLTAARGEYESAYGRVVSDWKVKNGTLALDVTLPANTTATVYVPATGDETVREGGKPVREAEGVRFLRTEPGYAVYAVGSGRYRFTSPRPSSAASGADGS